MSRTIGGSLLPSSDARILKPLGKLSVRPIPALDTHGLFYDGECLLAMHPNGYSCHELAVRMAKGDARGVRDQVAFLLACGGLSKPADHLVNLIEQC